MTATQSVVDLVLDDLVEAIRLGRSVLVQAALQGHDNVLRYLLHRINSSSSSSSNSDLTPSPDQSELGKALSAAFLGAAEQGHPRCLTALLESCAPILSPDVPGTQVAAANSEGDTALTLAASSGCNRDRGCVSQLFQHSPGSLVAAANESGETALMLASRNGHAGCVTQLLQHNPEAQVTAVDKAGNTALMLTAWKGHAACVCKLLQHIPGTQVAATRAGDTALMLAADGGHTECISQLLQHNPEAQVVAIDSAGATALLAAVWNNHPGCAALLLAHSPSAQIATLNVNQNSVVELAAGCGYPQCLDLLLAHNPQPQHLDAAWLSALQQWDATHARTSPHTQCLERLHAKGALLPRTAPEAEEAKNRLFIQEVGSRALVPDRANEAMLGLALNVRGKKRKAGQGEE